MTKAKRNPFPKAAIALISLFAVTLVINAYMVFLAVNNNHDLVSENYYQEAVDYDSHKENLNRAENLNLQLEVDCEGERCVIEASGDLEGKFLDGQKVELYRPSNKQWDKKAELLNSGGRYRTQNIRLQKGAWVAVIKISSAKGNVEKSVSFYV